MNKQTKNYCDIVYNVVQFVKMLTYIKDFYSF